jgi:hypothetical protein
MVKGFLKKIQEKPEKTRKIILWAMVSLVGIFLIILWGVVNFNKIGKFNKENFGKLLNLPRLQEKINSNTQPEITDTDIIEGIDKLKEELDNIEKATQQENLNNNEIKKEEPIK